MAIFQYALVNILHNLYPEQNHMLIAAGIGHMLQYTSEPSIEYTFHITPWTHGSGRKEENVLLKEERQSSKICQMKTMCILSVR